VSAAAADALLPLSTSPGPWSIADEVLHAKILIVDDLPANVTLLTRMLGGVGYTGVSSTSDARRVCDLHATHHYDLIVLDLQMPGMNGFEVMEGLKLVPADGDVPVLVITAQPDQKLRSLRAGARDFVGKPFDIAEVLMRVQNLLEVRLLHLALRRKTDELRALFDEVVAERRVSERLALQVPQRSIAARLPVRPDVTPESFAEATVLVADIVGFANLAPAATPAALALHLEELFGGFDGVAQAHGLRTIKTLGNAYMAIAGVPLALMDHAVRATLTALDIVESVTRFNARNDLALQVRVGVATGAVVAGVIGKRMYVDDAWGEAVNVAARLESHGVLGRVQVSDATRLSLGEGFTLEPQGGVEVQGIGVVTPWLVEQMAHPTATET
jgi:adenylate cyclase